MDTTPGKASGLPSPRNPVLAVLSSLKFALAVIVLIALACINLGEGGCLAQIGNTCVTLSDWRGLDQPISVLLGPPPLRSAVFAKTRVFPLIQPQFPDFSQRHAHFDEGLLALRDDLFQFAQPLILPDAQYNFVTLHICFR